MPNPARLSGRNRFCKSDLGSVPTHLNTSLKTSLNTLNAEKNSYGASSNIKGVVQGSAI